MLQAYRFDRIALPLAATNGASPKLRVLRSGVKTVGSDESRARSALAILMLLEWCVPTCDEAFRQALSGQRWVSRLIKLVLYFNPCTLALRTAYFRPPAHSLCARDRAGAPLD